MSSPSMVVLGGGSAGFLTAITCKARVPNISVTVIRSPEIGIIGVGEATTPYLLEHLHGYLEIDPAEFYQIAQPSWKLGIRFLWGPRPYFNYCFLSQCDFQYAKLPAPTGYFYTQSDFENGCPSSALMTQDRAFLRDANGGPMIRRDTAYHMENEYFVTFLEQHARKLGVEILDATVAEVKQDESGLTGLKLTNGQVIQKDLYIDCSGFRSLLLGQALGEEFISFKSSLYCDQAVIGGWAREDETFLPFSVAETMDSGWCWRIDHEHRINRGYVHSSDFISTEDAEREFRAKNPKLKEVRVVKYRSGRYRNAWVKNVIAVGNSAGFVEPLESTALSGICQIAQSIAESIRDAGCRPLSMYVSQFNEQFRRSWDTIRDFLAVHYRFNTRLQTPFWKACVADTDLAGAQQIVDFYRQHGPSPIWHHTLLDSLNQFKLDGFWTLLIGQAVPYERQRRFSDPVLADWRTIKDTWRQRAQQGLTAAEAMKIIRDPSWKWQPGFWTASGKLKYATSGVYAPAKGVKND